MGSPVEPVNNSAVAEPTDKELIAEVLDGHTASFEPLVVKYQPRIFALARRYARRENEVEDIAKRSSSRPSASSPAIRAQPV